MDSIPSKLMEHEVKIKNVEHRVKNLEDEMRNLRELTNAVAVTGENVKNLQEQFSEMHQDVKELKKIPASRWEKIVFTIITGVVGVVVGALMALIMK